MDATSFQVVFMVDVNGIIQRSGAEQSVGKQTNEIGLCAAKILLCYQNRFEAHKGSTTVNNQSTECQKFQFGYKFYNSLSQTIVRPSFKDCSLKSFDAFYDDVELRLEDEKLKADGSHVKKPSKEGAHSLSNALKEMIYDFTWEKNDLSPVRPKSRKKGQEAQSSHQNVVYLFSPCPHTSEELKEFMYDEKKKSPKKTPRKAKELAKTFLPQTLHQALKTISGIRVFWIDVDWLTELLYEGQEFPGKGYYLLNDALKTVGGCVIPIHAILQPQTDMMRAMLPAEDVVFCYNEIGNLTEDNKTVISFPTSKISYQIEISPIMKQDEEAISMPSKIEVIGSMESVNLDHLNCSVSFIVRSGESSALCETFRELSMNGRKLLVCLSSTKSHGITHALLQPMTKTSATLTGIHACHVVGMFKMLLPSQTEEVLDKSELNQFVQKHLDKMNVQNQMDKRLSEWTLVDEENNDGVTGNGKSFDMSMLQPWYVQPQERQPQDSSLVALLKKSTLANNSSLKQEQIAHRKLGRHFCMQKASSKDSINSSVPSPADPSSLGKRRSMDEKDAKPMTRGQMILERGRRLQASKRTSSQGVSVEILAAKVKPLMSFTAPPSDFQTDSDLADYLKEQYEKVMVSGEAYHQFSTMALNVVTFFFKSRNSEDYQDKTLKLLKEHIFINDTLLKKKHGSQTGNQEAKIREVQLQTFLQLEAESVLTKHDAEVNFKMVGQLARMLRTMSLASDNLALSRFLNKEILEAFSQLLPRTLSELYEEMMIPMPDTMTSLFSPSLTATPAFSDDESRGSNQPSLGNASIMSTELFSEESNPLSNKPKRGRFMSKDLGQNTKRIIALPQRRADAKSKPGGKLSRSMSTSGLPLTAEKEEPPRQKAVRNLTGAFVTGQSNSAQPQTRTMSRIDKGHGDASQAMASSRLIGRGLKQERRQSIAVMEKIMKTPPPKKVLKTTTVQDTPTHKRRLRSLMTSATTDEDVVCESPQKSPTDKGKRKHSFYDPTKKSRNVQKYEDQEVQPIKFKSPARGLAAGANSGFLFSQLSSPVAKSPRLLRRTPSRGNPGSAVKQSPRTPRALDLLLKSPRSSGRQVKRRLMGAEEETNSPRKAAKICVEDSPVRTRRTPIKPSVESPLVSRLRATPRSILKSPLARATPGKLGTPLRTTAMRAVKFDDTPSKKTISPNKSPKYNLRTSPTHASPSKKSPIVSPNVGKKSPAKKLPLIHAPVQKITLMSQSPELKYSLRKSPETGMSTPEKKKNSPAKKHSPTKTPSPNKKQKSPAKFPSPAKKLKSPKKSPKTVTDSHETEGRNLRSHRSPVLKTEKTPPKLQAPDSKSSTPSMKSIFKIMSFDFGGSPPRQDFDLGDLINRLDPSPGRSSSTTNTPMITPQKPPEQVAELMSPNSRPVIHTPESFNKWKRRKPHRNGSLTKSPHSESQTTSSQSSAQTSSQTSTQTSSQSDSKSPKLKVKRKSVRGPVLSPSEKQILRSVKIPGTPESVDSVVLISPIKPEYQHLLRDHGICSSKTEQKRSEIEKIVEEKTEAEMGYRGVTCAKAGIVVISPLTSSGVPKKTKMDSVCGSERILTPTDPQKDIRTTRSRSNEKTIPEDSEIAPEAETHKSARRSLCALENTTPNHEEYAKKSKTKVSTEKRKVKFSAEKTKSSTEKVKSSAEKGLRTSSEKARNELKRRSLERSSVEKNMAAMEGRVTRRSCSPSIIHNQNTDPSKNNSVGKKPKKTLFERPLESKSPLFQNTIPREAPDTSTDRRSTVSPGATTPASNKSSPALSMAPVDDLDNFDWSYWSKQFQPMRYTRGLSKECGLTPQDFRMMSTQSPVKNPTSAKIDIEITGRGSKRSLVSSPDVMMMSETPKRRRLDDSVDDDVFESVPVSPAIRKLQNGSPVSAKKAFSPVTTKGMFTLLCSPILAGGKEDSEHSEKRSRRSLYK